MTHRPSHRQTASLVSTLALASSFFVSGCGLSGGSGGPGAGTTVGPLSPPTIRGSIIGGQNPVKGATIQLYQIGTGVGTSYTASAAPLLSSVVSSDAGGNFSLTGLYNCTPGKYLYITAAGGDPGLGTSTNANITMMASVGLCDNLTPATFIAVNEVTTVAMAYAFAQFGKTSLFGTPLSAQSAGAITPAINFATSSTNVQGIANAAAWANVLANPMTGTSPGSNGNGTLGSPLVFNAAGAGATGAVPEFWQINTIANMLAACINSAGLTSSGDTTSSCGVLFNNVVRLPGTAVPADTAQAALDLALMPTVPSANITKLFNLIPATAPFLPYVTTAASIIDFTVGVQVQPVIPGTSTRLVTQPTWTGADSNGNIWVANQSTLLTHQASLLELSPTGVPIQAGTVAGTGLSNYLITSYAKNGTATNFAGQFQNNAGTYSKLGVLAGSIDTNNNVWINDRAGDAVIKAIGSGATGAGTNHNGGNAGDPGGNGAFGAPLVTGAAPTLTFVDGSNNVWTMLGAYLNGVAQPWVAGSTCGSAYSTYNKGLIGFLGGDPTHGAYNPNTYMNGPFAVAVDPNVTNTVTPSGGTATAIPGAPFIWTPNSNTLIHQYTGGTTPGCDTPLSLITSTGVAGTTAIPGQVISGTDVAYATGSSTYDVAFDSKGYIWITRPSGVDPANVPVNAPAAVVKMLPNYGAAFTPAQAVANTTFTYFFGVAGYSAAYSPRIISIDGDGNAWIGFSTGGKVGEISNNGDPLSPVNTGSSPGFAGSTCTACKYNGGTAQTYARSTLSPGRVSFDLSGNVWMGLGGTGASSIIVLVGAAGPTVSPNALGLANRTLATRP